MSETRLPMLVNVLVFPMFFLAGVFFPVESVPVRMEVLSKINPVTYGVDAIRQITLVLRPNVSRWTNVVLAILYVVSIVASGIGETSAYFVFLSAVEVAVLLMIVRYAWTWPRRAGTTGSDQVRAM